MAERTEDVAATDPPREARREREVRSERRMSDVEAMMWNVEKDPFLNSTFGSVTVLDQPADVGRLRRRLLQMVVRIPRLHQRVVPGLGRFAPPEWHDDPNFDIDFHFRHVALPAPGTERQLWDLASQIVQDPFDRTRPLWEFVLIDGLEGGRGAMVQKMHHTITDGEGGIRMSEQFIDVVREAPDVDEVVITPEPPPPHTNVFETAADTFAHTFRRSIGVAQRAAGEAVDAVCHPSRITALPGDVAMLAGSAVRQITITDHAHSPLWTERSLRRRFEVLDVPFDDAYRAAKALGGSLNDFFVTGAAGGAGAYHRELGEPVDTLRMAMPISTRKDKAAGGNSFVPTRELVPAGIEDPAARFAAVHEILTRTKGEKILGVVDGAAGFVNMLPTSVLVRFARQQTETIDFTTSNVRAANFDLYIAGALIEGTYPLGPLAGTAFNLTMMSYRGQLNMGLYVDTGAIADPDLLRRCLVEAYAETIAAGT
jgi:diacylglycerol O-acyltransferase / wax synthase